MSDRTPDPTPGVAYDNMRPNADPTRRTPDPTPDLTLTPTPEHLNMDALAIPAAAERLGLTTDAIRMRLKRGTLPGRKVEGRWVVLVPRLNADRTSTERDEREDPTPATATQHPTDQPTERDQSSLAPLADLIAELTRENRDLSAAAALWQERARFLGERLQALEAGPIDPVASAGDQPVQNATPPLPRDETPPASPEPERPWWRRLVDRLP